MAKKKLSSFERAFVAARRSGAKDFSFGGKKYNTKRKGEGGGGKRTAQASTPKSGSSRPKDVPTPTPKPSQSSGHMGGVVGRVGEMGKRIFSSTSDPKTLFKDKGKRADAAVPKPNKTPTPTPRPDAPTPASAPKPTARPASPGDRQARRTAAYLTNVSGAPATGESTFAKTVHGMENMRPPKPKPSLTKQQRSDSEWNARDTADTRKRMEEAKTPRPGKTGGVPSENRFVRGSVSVAKAPQGKVMDGSLNRGISGKTTVVGGTAFKTPASGKTARLPQNEARTTPKTDRLKKKTTVVARK